MTFARPCGAAAAARRPRYRAASRSPAFLNWRRPAPTSCRAARSRTRRRPPTSALKSNLPDRDLDAAVSLGWRSARHAGGRAPRARARSRAARARSAGAMHWLETTGSTNDVAAHLAQLGADEGTTVVAETQTAGRGRHGRVWFSPPGAGLYVSVILRPAGGLATRGQSGGAADARQRRRDCGSRARRDRPARGNQMAERRGRSAGASLPAFLPRRPRRPASFSSSCSDSASTCRRLRIRLSLQSRVTSIEAETSRPADRALMLAEILAAIAERYADLRAERFDAILSAWRRLAPSLPSAPVEWDSPDGVVRGRAEGHRRTRRAARARRRQASSGSSRAR